MAGRLLFVVGSMQFLHQPGSRQVSQVSGEGWPGRPSGGGLAVSDTVGTAACSQIWLAAGLLWWSNMTHNAEQQHL
jgi:hypothetical protein